MSLDERNQILTTNLYVFFEWNDKRLKWNISNYGNTEAISVPANNFWLPDLAILNTVAGTSSLIVYPTNQNIQICSITI